jgi:NAD-dependent deacetylase
MDAAFDAFKHIVSADTSNWLANVNTKLRIELFIIEGLMSYHKGEYYDALINFEFGLKMDENNYAANYYIAVLKTTCEIKTPNNNANNNDNNNNNPQKINEYWKAAIANCPNQLIRERIMGQYEDWIRYLDTAAPNMNINTGKCYLPWISVTMPYHGLIHKYDNNFNTSTKNTDSDNRETLKFDVSAYITSIFKRKKQTNDYESVKEIIKNAPSKSVILLTGAGLSKDFGYPTRKDMWSCFDKDEAVSAVGFAENPKYLWSVVRQFYEKASRHTITKNKNPYAMLDTLYEKDLIKLCITQNVEGLHREPVVELHGTLNRLICPKCFATFDEPAKNHISDIFIPTCTLGTILKPDVVLFGEMVKSENLRIAMNAISDAKIMLIIGTAADVSPCTDLIRYARSKNVRLIEINENETRISRLVDHMITMPVTIALSKILDIS